MGLGHGRLWGGFPVVEWEGIEANRKKNHTLTVKKTLPEWQGFWSLASLIIDNKHFWGEFYLRLSVLFTVRAREFDRRFAVASE